MDILVETAGAALLVEAKSAVTIASDFFDSLRLLSSLLEAKRMPTRSCVVYGGDASRSQSSIAVIPWSQIAGGPWAVGRPRRDGATRRRPKA